MLSGDVAGVRTGMLPRAEEETAVETVLGYLVAVVAVADRMMAAAGD